jgi:hypothetical protein
MAGIGGNAKIVAEVSGGKPRSGCYFANFVSLKAAANTGAATVVAQVRQQQGRLALLRHFRHLDGGNEGMMRHFCETARCRCIRCIPNLADSALGQFSAIIP